MAGSRTKFRLDYLPPYDWASMRAWLEARALPGVEQVSLHGYARTTRVGDACAIVDVIHRPEDAAFDVTVVAERPIDESAIRPSLMRVLDLDRDPRVMRSRVAGDPWLASLSERYPGLRVPGGWEPFELACRAVLGQQVSVTAARQLVATLVDICGGIVPAPLATAGCLRVFPTPPQLLAADLARLRMPGARKATLTALADAAQEDSTLFEPHVDLETVIARLRHVKGIGDWTAHYIALRALRHPDAFPASDAGLLRGASETGRRPAPAALRARADAWRPDRAYAAQLLWAHDVDTALPTVPPTSVTRSKMTRPDSDWRPSTRGTAVPRPSNASAAPVSVAGPKEQRRG